MSSVVINQKAFFGTIHSFSFKADGSWQSRRRLARIPKNRYFQDMKALFLLVVFTLSGCAQKLYVKNFESPEQTFETWRQAAVRLDLQTLIESYSQSARAKIEQDLASSTENALRQMKREAKETKFSLEKIVYEEDVAYLRVKRERNRMSEIEVLTMVNESGAWKLLP